MVSSTEEMLHPGQPQISGTGVGSSDGSDEAAGSVDGSDEGKAVGKHAALGPQACGQSSSAIFDRPQFPYIS